jgi:hypothetical protein
MSWRNRPVPLSRLSVVSILQHPLRYNHRRFSTILISFTHSPGPATHSSRSTQLKFHALLSHPSPPSNSFSTIERLLIYYLIWSKCLVLLHIDVALHHYFRLPSLKIVVFYVIAKADRFLTRHGSKIVELEVHDHDSNIFEFCPNMTLLKCGFWVCLSLLNADGTYPNFSRNPILNFSIAKTITFLWRKFY